MARKSQPHRARFGPNFAHCPKSANLSPEAVHLSRNRPTLTPSWPNLSQTGGGTEIPVERSLIDVAYAACIDVRRSWRLEGFLLCPGSSFDKTGETFVISAARGRLWQRARLHAGCPHKCGAGQVRRIRGDVGRFWCDSAQASAHLEVGPSSGRCRPNCGGSDQCRGHVYQFGAHWPIQPSPWASYGRFGLLRIARVKLLK